METYRHVSQIINTNLNHTKGLLAPENTPYALPFTFLRGAKPGPSLVVTGGLHSGEYPGVAACARLSQTLSPEDLAGSVLLLHCVNETGFFAHSEALVPEGNVNLNGDFPGDLSGTPGKRLAAFMEQEIMPFADYILDLHSGGGMEPLSPCLFFPVTAGENVLRTSLKMAAATGIEHLVASSAKTGFYSFAAQHGVPGLPRGGADERPDNGQHRHAERQHPAVRCGPHAPEQQREHEIQNQDNAQKPLADFVESDRHGR